MISILYFTKSIHVTCPLDLFRNAGRPEFLSAFLTEKLSLKYNLAEERSRARKETWGFYTLPNAFCSLVGEKMASDTLTGP